MRQSLQVIVLISLLKTLGVRNVPAQSLLDQVPLGSDI